MKRTPLGIYFSKLTSVVRAVLSGTLESPTEEVFLNPGMGRLIDVEVDTTTINIDAYDAMSAIAIRLTGTPGLSSDIVFPTSILSEGQCLMRVIINETDAQHVIKFGAFEDVVVVRPKDTEILFGGAVEAIADGDEDSAYPHTMWVMVTATGVYPVPGYSEAPPDP